MNTSLLLSLVSLLIVIVGFYVLFSLNYDSIISFLSVLFVLGNLTSSGFAIYELVKGKRTHHANWALFINFSIIVLLLGMVGFLWGMRDMAI